eukprot:2873008-Rhodomonas_salina.1
MVGSRGTGAREREEGGAREREEQGPEPAQRARDLLQGARDLLAHARDRTMPMPLCSCEQSPFVGAMKPPLFTALRSPSSVYQSPVARCAVSGGHVPAVLTRVTWSAQAAGTAKKVAGPKVVAHDNLKAQAGLKAHKVVPVRTLARAI